MEGPGGKRKETLGNRRNFRGKAEVKAEVKAGVGLLPEMEEKLIGEGRDGGNWATVVKNGIGRAGIVLLASNALPDQVRRCPVPFRHPKNACLQGRRYRNDLVENGIERSFVGGDGAFHHHERNRPVAAPGLP